jgi:NAD(P)-dependent dehydrogenase (short-subunit alcohol dehydrogenase family)
MIGSDANRIRIITGSSSGIGFETALPLAGMGLVFMLQRAILRNLRSNK